MLCSMEFVGCIRLFLFAWFVLCFKHIIWNISAKTFSNSNMTVEWDSFGISVSVCSFLAKFFFTHFQLDLSQHNNLLSTDSWPPLKCATSIGNNTSLCTISTFPPDGFDGISCIIYVLFTFKGLQVENEICICRRVKAGRYHIFSQYLVSHFAIFEKLSHFKNSIIISTSFLIGIFHRNTEWYESYEITNTHNRTTILRPVYI